MRYVFLLLSLFSFGAFASTCPDGYIELTLNTVINVAAACNPDEADLGEIAARCGKDSSICMPDLICTGASAIRAGDNIRIPLYETRYTTPVIGIEIGQQVCYANLVPGAETGTINLEYNGTVYHSNKLHKCLAFNVDSLSSIETSADYTVRWAATVGSAAVSGISYCSSRSGSLGTLLDELSISNTAADNKHCWCRVMKPIPTPWTFGAEYASSNLCDQQCVQRCANRFSDTVSFRTALISAMEL